MNAAVEYEELLKKFNIEIVKYGGGISKFSDFHCLNCDHRWRTTLSVLKKAKFGCRKCANVNNRKCRTDIENTLVEKQISSLYINNNTNHKSILKCDICEHSWSASIASICSLDTGCPICFAKNRTSKIANKCLDELNIKIREKYFLIEGRKIFVDGFDEDTNCIYEFYGTYWHADPRFYGPNDIVNGKPAALKWEKDAERISLLKNAGYEIKIFWEHDYRQSLKR